MDGKVTVRDFLINNYVHRDVLRFTANLSLVDALNEFQTGRSHLAIVQITKNATNERRRRSSYKDILIGNKSNSNSIKADGNDNKILGIVTLEDVIESLIQEPIQDETDISHEMEMIGIK